MFVVELGVGLGHMMLLSGDTPHLGTDFIDRTIHLTDGLLEDGLGSKSLDLGNDGVGGAGDNPADS